MREEDDKLELWLIFNLLQIKLQKNLEKIIGIGGDPETFLSGLALTENTHKKAVD